MFDHQHGTARVDAKGPIPCVGIHFCQRRIGLHLLKPRVGRIVVEYVDPAKFFYGSCHDRLDAGRSEEHTSELQSLMRNSYAVFCLKKKKRLLISIYTRSQL